MEMIYEKKKLLVHPTRMPITTQEVSDAICTVQRRCGFKAGEAGRWSAQAWDYLFKFLGRCKPVRNRMICSGAGFGTTWPQAISNGQQADSRKPFLLDKYAPDMVSLGRSLGLPTGCLELLPELHSAPPFDCDLSHWLVLCGGYAGCLRCGSVVLTKRLSRLKRPCRRFIPTCHSKFRIGRLCRSCCPYVRPLGE